MNIVHIEREKKIKKETKNIAISYTIWVTDDLVSLPTNTNFYSILNNIYVFTHEH